MPFLHQVMVSGLTCQQTHQGCREDPGGYGREGPSGNEHDDGRRCQCRQRASVPAEGHRDDNRNQHRTGHGVDEAFNTGLIRTNDMTNAPPYRVANVTTAIRAIMIRIPVGVVSTVMAPPRHDGAGQPDRFQAIRSQPPHRRAHQQPHECWVATNAMPPGQRARRQSTLPGYEETSCLPGPWPAKSNPVPCPGPGPGVP